ncbi:F-box protein (macronuclear) [Tetrahymena thermophila SB210]|uniref:F-box protein n=1 Tax=Tetrahymena thermophila (strain SB210) TaxID=312017 RepID=Q22CH9_TETTS|nr:F-box protein [Tetrahymena thermophila SB210]EAR83013.2 F-box protein [Tetrahymena thermophila SB210]|eukprot:XP_001030676.2 F-box protein [Tetrahymena thermophila SB210]
MSINYNKRLINKSTTSQTENIFLHKKSISTSNKVVEPISKKQGVSSQKTDSAQQKPTEKVQIIPDIIGNSKQQVEVKNQEDLLAKSSNQKENINNYLGKNQMNIIFKYCSFKHLISLRLTCKSWWLLIDNYISNQIPLLVSERNQLEVSVKNQMESESSHTRYVRAYKKVSLGHDLIFCLNQNDAEKFYLLKDKSEYIKEIRSITHQIIGKNVIEKNKEIKKYSPQYYIEIIQECKEVQVSEIPKDIILRMKIIFQHNQQIADEQLNKISRYAYALKVLLAGYLHLYQETNPQQSQKARLKSIQEDLHIIKIYNKNKVLNSK